MSTARCATCSTLRPANASYCPNCGTPFGRSGPRPIERTDPAGPPTDLDIPSDLAFGRITVDVSLWTGVKLGAGFVVGAALVSVLLLLIVIVGLGIGVAGLNR